MKILLLVIFLSQSCSTLTKSKTYGAISGALICGTLGIYLGKELSPDKESDNFNKLIGLGAGSTLCGLTGYYLGKGLYKNDPANKEYVPLEFNKKVYTPKQEMLNQDSNGLELSDLSIQKIDEIDIPAIKNLPKELREKIDKQKIIRHNIAPQSIKTKDGRTLYFNGGVAIEHQYQKTQ